MITWLSCLGHIFCELYLDLEFTCLLLFTDEECDETGTPIEVEKPERTELPVLPPKEESSSEKTSNAKGTTTDGKSSQQIESENKPKDASTSDKHEEERVKSSASTQSDNSEHLRAILGTYMIQFHYCTISLLLICIQSQMCSSWFWALLYQGVL